MLLGVRVGVRTGVDANEQQQQYISLFSPVSLAPSPDVGCSLSLFRDQGSSSLNRRPTTPSSPPSHLGGVQGSQLAGKAGQELSVA